MTFISSLIVPEAWPERNGPRPPRRLSPLPTPQRRMYRVWITFFESNWISLRIPWNAMRCCETRIISVDRRTRAPMQQRAAESLGFKGEFHQWEHLLRVGE